jgi:hypothetical protein
LARPRAEEGQGEEGVDLQREDRDGPPLACAGLSPPFLTHSFPTFLLRFLFFFVVGLHTGTALPPHPCSACISFFYLC